MTKPAELDPERVAREGSKEDADQWPWVTEIEVLLSVRLAEGPTLEAIGVPTASIRQHDHIRLRPDQYRRALDAIKG